MATTVTEPVVEYIGGLRYLSWTITEDQVDATAEFVVKGVPTFCTLTLYEAGPSEGAPTGQFLAPEIRTHGVDQSPDPQDPLKLVVMNDGQEKVIRNGCHIHIITPTKELHVMSKPSVTGAKITTRITVREGH